MLSDGNTQLEQRVLGSVGLAEKPIVDLRHLVQLS
jgi:hypothetical protein